MLDLGKFDARSARYEFIDHAAQPDNRDPVLYSILTTTRVRPANRGTALGGLALPESIAVRSATPYLIVRGAARAIQFYVEAFGAIEADRMVGSDGRIEHAELRIAASRLYLADEHPEIEMIVGPESLGGTSVIIDLEVDDVEAVFERAVVAGAREVRPVDHPSSGVQSAKVIDPFGHVWLITRIVGS